MLLLINVLRLPMEQSVFLVRTERVVEMAGGHLADDHRIGSGNRYFIFPYARL